jgi:dCTP deaminase
LPPAVAAAEKDPVTPLSDTRALGLPGVLPRQALRKLVDDGTIWSNQGILDANIQPASVDLTLGAVAYRLRCSFLPGDKSVRQKLREYDMGELDLARGAVLEQNRPYLIPLNEHLRLPPELRGRTNPRSSTGRVDVFTRVVTDKGRHFDEIPGGYEGELFLEVVPRSFTIRVRAGLTLNQLRIISGESRVPDLELIRLSLTNPIIFPGTSATPGERAAVSDGLFLSVDLSGGGRKFVGYKARKSSALLDLERSNTYNVADFWERVEPRKKRLILDPEEFYLLVSRERVRIPPGFAAEMAAYDPTSGELRTHYAGFFDPGFGDVPEGDRPGTPAVLEVRAHDVSFALEHGQRLCKLTFERMAAPPDQAYGEGIGSRYQRQYLALGRQFKPERAQREVPRGFKAGEREPLRLELLSGDGTETSPLPVAARD